MTHLSDLSYLQRGVSTSWFYGWFIIYVYRWDRFEALRLRRLLRFELRSVVTILVLISLALQLAYDIGSARLKYIEGFWVNPESQKIQSTPAQLWSEKDTVHVEPLYYTLACSLALESCIFFLLQAFWSYISKSVTKSSFMSSLEFKINVAASCIVVALFPTIQYLFRKDFVYREVVPQIIFSTLLIIIGILGIRTHFKLMVLVRNAREIMNETTASVVHKLEYFKDMNIILTFSLFACGLALGITSADGLLPNPVIAHNKFASDLLITNLNFFEFIIWVTLTLIFYPRKTGVSSPFGSSNASNKRDSKDAHLPRFNEVRPQGGDILYKSEAYKEHKSTGPIAHGETLAHHRNHSVSTDNSRQATLVPMDNQLPKAPAPLHTASSKIETSTIYYHEGLAKAQFEQQAEQANKHYIQDMESDTLPDPTDLPPTRSFSQASHRSNHSQSHHSIPTRSFSQTSHRSNHSQSHRPTSHGNQIPLKNIKQHIRSTSRDYGSLAQESVNWSSQSGPHSRTPSTSNQTYPPDVSDTAKLTSTIQGRDSDESDRSIIHTTYIRNADPGVGPYGSFYEGVSQEDGAIAMAPNTTRHF
ncbi:hypothetical protein BG011_006826 [Mortierella polycephala]|uniref:Uncharacterized protein n=1 Tax=Mortierella polycephala TaxID=41804 RepID=A0A9P6PV43_9FUNG|nr:hypothetical protein BG011_006826 [Mortierella polycephala]